MTTPKDAMRETSAALRADAPEDERPPEFSDDALALEFTRQCGTACRYTAKWGRWHHWEGSVWREDATLNVYDRIRAILREVAKRCGKPTIAASIASARTVVNVERLAKSDRTHAAVVEQWDSDIWRINTPAGVVDLRTGALSPSTPEQYMTRQTNAAPSDERPVRWFAFLDRVTGGDRELQSFLQRVTGYCLTGTTQTHAMFFFYGTGGNGKGTFLNTIAHLLGDYAKTAPIGAFTASKFERHSTELAMLQGARLVSAQETEEGRRWDEAKIKALTGGDTITARFMQKDNFEFRPQFKLLIAGNHKPQLRNVDEAMRRRLHLVPFTQTIPAAERIEGLDEQLRAELPGIFAWAIEGCLAWQRDGLQPPESVRTATEEYFEGEDSFQEWLDENCELRPGAQSTSAELFRSWSEWSQRAGEAATSQRSFSQKLESHGFPRITIGHAKTRGFAGLRISDIAKARGDRASVA